MTWRRWALATIASIASIAACNAFRKSDECTANRDCARGTMCAAEGSYCRTGGPILVGFLSGLTGPQQTLSEPRRVALEFGRWIVERDPDRKVLGRGIEIHLEDTLSTLAEVPAATTRIIDQNIAALIGPGPSAEVLEAQKQTFPRQLLHLAPSSGAPTVGEAQPADPYQRFLFQMVTSVHGLVPTLPLFLSKENKPPPNYDVCLDSMAIVTTDDTLGVPLKSELEAILAKNCVKVTASMTVPRTKKPSYATEVAALLAAAKDGSPTRCLFLGTEPEVAGELLRTLKDRQQKSSRQAYSAFIGSGTLNATNFFDDAKSAVAGEPSLAEGFYGIDADGTPERVEFRDLTDLWNQYLLSQTAIPPGTPMDPNGVPYTEAVIILALAIELAGTVEDPVALRNALVDVANPGDGDHIIGPKDIAAAFALIRTARNDGRRAAIDYHGSYSNLDFDSHGFVQTSTAVWHAKDGKINAREKGFTEQQVLAVSEADPGPLCPPK